MIPNINVIKVLNNDNGRVAIVEAYMHESTRIIFGEIVPTNVYVICIDVFVF